MSIRPLRGRAPAAVGDGIPVVRAALSGGPPGRPIGVIAGGSARLPTPAKGGSFARLGPL